MPSSRTVVEKLHLKQGMTVLVIDPPEGYLEHIGDLPQEVRMAEAPEKDMDVIQIFVTSMEQFEARVKLMLPYLKSSSILWVTYPKGTSGVETDLNRDIIWRRARELEWKQWRTSRWTMCGQR